MPKHKNSILRDDLIKIFGGRKQFNDVKGLTIYGPSGQVGDLCVLSTSVKVVLIASGPNCLYHLEGHSNAIRRTKYAIAKKKHHRITPIALRPASNSEEVEISRTRAAEESEGTPGLSFGKTVGEEVAAPAMASQETSEGAETTDPELARMATAP